MLAPNNKQLLRATSIAQHLHRFMKAKSSFSLPRRSSVYRKHAVLLSFQLAYLRPQHFPGNTQVGILCRYSQINKPAAVGCELEQVQLAGQRDKDIINTLIGELQGCHGLLFLPHYFGIERGGRGGVDSGSGVSCQASA